MAPGSFDFESWEEVLRVNLLGPAALAEALIENVAASERRTIAMMSSRLGSISESSGMTLPYSTSKAALNMLVKGLAATLASRKHHCGRAEPRLGAHRHGRRRRAALARGVGARAAQSDRRLEASRLGKILLARRLGDCLVKNLIAKLEVVGVREGGERVELRPEIGRPREERDGRWACSIEIAPLETQPEDVRGTDSFHAVWLACALVLSCWRTSRPTAGACATRTAPSSLWKPTAPG